MSYCRFRVMADSTPTLKQRLAGRSLYLVGMMGSGKTSTAVLVLPLPIIPTR